jgi:hypothetical protein
MADSLLQRNARRIPSVALHSLLLAALLGTEPRAARAVEPGATITAERAADVNDVLFPGVVEAVRRGMRIEVVEPRPVRWRRGFSAATEQYAGQVMLGSKGELQNYVAGLPFPHVDGTDPRAGLKMMWNYAFGPWISDDSQSWSFEWQSGRLATGEPMRVEASQKDDSERHKFMRLVGRTEVPPRPAVPGNAARVFSKEIYGATLPVFQTLDRSGPLLVYRYLDLREPDVWFYSAPDRKVRRLPSRILYDAPGDTVLDLNTLWGFSASLGSYRFRFVEERAMLGVLHARRYPAEWCPAGGDFAACETWEPRTVYVIEALPQKADDPYGKRLIALDKHAWVVVASDLFDRQGQLWKTYMNFWSYQAYAPGGDEGERPYLLAASCVDLRENKAYRWRLPGTRPLAASVAINTGLTEDLFSTATLGSARAD